MGFLSLPAVAHADACVNGTVKRGGSGGDYFLCQGGAWLHVVPTFDPNSADGYGPNQPAAVVCEVSGPVHVPDRWASPRCGRHQVLIPRLRPRLIPQAGFRGSAGNSSHIADASCCWHGKCQSLTRYITWQPVPTDAPPPSRLGRPVLQHRLVLSTVDPWVMISAVGDTEYCTPLFVATKVAPVCTGSSISTDNPFCRPTPL